MRLALLLACSGSTPPAETPLESQPSAASSSPDEAPIRDAPSAAPAWTVDEQCLVRDKGRPVTSRNPADRDLDGDGIADRYAHHTDAGSWEGGTDVLLDLSRSGKQRVSAVFWFGNMHHIVEAPEALWDLPRARNIVEAVVFGTACQTPDPSLRWLLRDPRSMEWIEGQLVIPPFYGSWDAERHAWHSVAGHMHDADHSEPNYPILDAERGDQRLIRTAHGVVLQEPERYAWLWVHDRGEGKLRWATVARSRFVGDEVEISFHGVNGLDAASPIRIPVPERAR